MSSTYDSSYILRLTSEAAEVGLFTNRWLYVGLRRGWTRGSRVLFARKMEVFLGSGIIARVHQIEELDAQERQLCLEKNWSAKILFSTLTRFVPPVPIDAAHIASENPLTLHGFLISVEKFHEIEARAHARISF